MSRETITTTTPLGPISLAILRCDFCGHTKPDDAALIGWLEIRRIGLLTVQDWQERHYCSELHAARDLVPLSLAEPAAEEAGKPQEGGGRSNAP